MAQITHGLRKILEIPWIYQSFQSLMGATRVRRYLSDEFIQAQPGQSLLDVGCGPGDLLTVLPEGVDYTGFDFEASYIEQAKRRFGERGTFICDDVNTFSFEGRTFNRIVLCALLHHLEDEEATKLLQTLSNLLTPSGTLSFLEPVFAEGQHSMARWLISRDRGQNVRDAEGYRALCPPSLTVDREEIRHDLCRFPYTQLLVRTKASEENS